METYRTSPLFLQLCMYVYVYIIYIFLLLYVFSMFQPLNDYDALYHKQ